MTAEDLPADPRAVATAAHLRYVSDREPCYRRVRDGEDAALSGKIEREGLTAEEVAVTAFLSRSLGKALADAA